MLNPSVAIIATSTTASFTSITILTTNEDFSKQKLRYNKRRELIKVISLFHEKSLKQTMVEIENNDQEAQEFKKIYSFSLDKKTDVKKITEFKVEDVFGGIANKESISPEEINTINRYLAKKMLK